MKTRSAGLSAPQWRDPRRESWRQTGCRVQLPGPAGETATARGAKGTLRPALEETTPSSALRVILCARRVLFEFVLARTQA